MSDFPDNAHPLRKFKTLSNLLTHYQNAPPEKQVKLAEKYSAEILNWIYPLVREGAEISLSELNGLLTFLPFSEIDQTIQSTKFYQFFKTLKYTDEAFEFFLTSFENMPPTFFLQIMANFTQFQKLLFYKNISPLQKIEGKSLYFYINILKIKSDSDIDKIFDYLYEQGLDYLENYQDLIDSSMISLVLNKLEISKISQKIFVDIIEDIHIMEYDEDFSFIENVLESHNYFSLNILISLYWLHIDYQENYQREYPFFLNYLKAHLTEEIMQELMAIENNFHMVLVIGKWYGYEKIEPSLHKRYLEEDFAKNNYEMVMSKIMVFRKEKYPYMGEIKVMLREKIFAELDKYRKSKDEQLGERINLLKEEIWKDQESCVKMFFEDMTTREVKETKFEDEILNEMKLLFEAYYLLK